MKASSIKKQKTKQKTVDVFLIAFVFIIACFVAFPLFWMLRSSLVTLSLIHIYLRPPVRWGWPARNGVGC